MDTNRYPCVHQALIGLNREGQQKSYLLQKVGSLPLDQQQQGLVGIEATLSTLASYQGYAEAAKNLLLGRSWDEYMEYWWMLKVAHYLSEKGFLREMEVKLLNGSIPDIRAEAELEGRCVPFYVEAKSWRFHSSLEVSSMNSDVSPDERVERMKTRLLKQLPEDSLGVWAWSKMRDGASGAYTLGSHGPKLGIEEMGVIGEVCAAVPQIAAVIVLTSHPDSKEVLWTVPSLSSKWPRSLAEQLVAALNSAMP